MKNNISPNGLGWEYLDTIRRRSGLPNSYEWKTAMELNDFFWQEKTKSLQSRIEQLEAVVKELVELKDLKDSQGKTEDYLRRQPLAWENAKTQLNK